MARKPAQPPEPTPADSAGAPPDAPAATQTPAEPPKTAPDPTPGPEPPKTAPDPTPGPEPPKTAPGPTRGPEPPARRRTPEPDTTTAVRRDGGLRGRGRVVGASEILAPSAPPPEEPADTPTDSRRKMRVMTIPKDTLTRVRKSGVYKVDLILIAASRYGHHIQETPRRQVSGRGRFVVCLSDEEHARLRRIAKRRGWPLSPTVDTLLNLYLSDIENLKNKKANRTRAQR